MTDRICLDSESRSRLALFLVFTLCVCALIACGDEPRSTSGLDGDTESSGRERPGPGETDQPSDGDPERPDDDPTPVDTDPTSPVIEASPMELEFGRVSIEETTQQVLTLSNVGGGDLGARRV